VEDDDALIFLKKIAALAQKIFWVMANSTLKLINI
jgi:hypothetical protein